MIVVVFGWPNSSRANRAAEDLRYDSAAPIHKHRQCHVSRVPHRRVGHRQRLPAQLDCCRSGHHYSRDDSHPSHTTRLDFVWNLSPFQ